MKDSAFLHTTAALLLAIASGSCLAADPGVPVRGPMPFESMDTDHDGFVSQEEYRQAFGEREQKRIERPTPYLYRNRDRAPKYEDIDTDHDGRISREELRSHQQQRLKQRQQERRQRYQEHLKWQQEHGVPPGGGMPPGSVGGGDR